MWVGRFRRPVAGCICRASNLDPVSRPPKGLFESDFQVVDLERVDGVLFVDVDNVNINGIFIIFEDHAVLFFVHPELVAGFKFPSLGDWRRGASESADDDPARWW